MDAQMMALGELFGKKDILYEIPPFQRPYVWDEEQQWEPLWHDVRDAAEGYLERLELNPTGLTAEQSAAQHFLGAVVLQQKPTKLLDIETVVVIDGQQRMITLQLLLLAATNVMHHKDQPAIYKKLGQTIRNNLADFPSAKVVPTDKDRDPFNRLMDNSYSSFPGVPKPRVVEAYEYFKDRLQKWVDIDGPERLQDRSTAIATALIGLLKIAVIDIEAKESAYEIFESLNARGTPLLPSDLIKNYIIEQASEEQTSLDCSEQWTSRFDCDWWSDGEIRFGNEVRNRTNQFLNCYLVMKTADPRIKSAKMLTEFKNVHQNSAGEMLDTVKSLGTAADRYREFCPEHMPGTHSQRLKEFFLRWRPLGVNVMDSIVLWFMTAHDVSEHDTETALSALESYLIRRAICRLPSNRYNDMTRTLLPALHKCTENSTNPKEAVIGYLRQFSDADTAAWPSDAMLIREATRQPIGKSKATRTKMILSAIEDHLRMSAGSESSAPPDLTLEHIMPVKWDKNWASARQRHKVDDLVQTVGNLTLLSKTSNSKLSNRSWAHKKKAMEEGSSVLLLNTGPHGVCKNAVWNETSIKKRSMSLAQTAAEIWPGPQSDHWD